MKPPIGTRARRAASFICGALLLFAPLVHADFVASEAEERAQQAKIARGYPASAATALAPYPGAKLDVRCSINRWGGDTDTYAFRTSDPIERVQSFYKANPPDPTRGRLYVTKDACDGESHVAVMLDLYPPAKVAKLQAAAKARLAAIDQLAASPPDPALLGQPLLPDAKFDAECTYDANRSLSSDIERVACYRIDAPNRDAAYQQLRGIGVFSGPWDNNVIVSIREEHAPPIRLEYRIGKGGPTKSLAERQAAAAPATTGSSAPTAATASTSAPAPAAPTKQNPVDSAKDAVNKLKGLFGR